MTEIEEVKKDIQELESLLDIVSRPKIKEVINTELHKFKLNLVHLEEIARRVKASESVSTIQKCYQVKLNNYAWDQTSSFVKLYVTLKDVQNIPAENVTCTFTAKSIELFVKELDNKDYSLTIKNLLENINPEKSYWKVKTDMVIVFMSKTTTNKWSHITGLEKKASESKVPKFDDDDTKDPSASLMNMMKKMYESGDDDMKRTIAKAWTESHSKRSEMPGF